MSKTRKRRKASVFSGIPILSEYNLRCSLIEGFHVTSYQANFASHPTRDRHVGFLLAWRGIGKHDKMSRYFLFSSYHNTKL